MNCVSGKAEKSKKTIPLAEGLFHIG